MPPSPASPSPTRSSCPFTNLTPATASWPTFVLRRYARITQPNVDAPNPRVIKRKYVKWHIM